jgi:hypothetical protein
MKSRQVRIRELAAWGFDAYKYRPETLEIAYTSNAPKRLAPSPYHLSNPPLAQETDTLHEKFMALAKRPDLQAEMSGLSWRLGVVDIRSLLAFQRRLVFNTHVAQPAIPAIDDWDALLALSFGLQKPIDREATYERSSETLILRSDNPSLHVRLTDDPENPLRVHAGSPFFEVARFRGRWFLRDGYHRAYALLKADIFAVPAVVVEARTIEELGAIHPWFFPEDILFSDRPPLVTDFLNDGLVFEYDRQHFIKTIRIKLEETLEPQPFPGEQA